MEIWNIVAFIRGYPSCLLCIKPHIFFFFFDTRLYPISITRNGNSRSSDTDPPGPDRNGKGRKRGEACGKPLSPTLIQSWLTGQGEGTESPRFPETQSR
jgi:hypothetical protein